MIPCILGTKRHRTLIVAYNLLTRASKFVYILRRYAQTYITALGVSICVINEKMKRTRMTSRMLRSPVKHTWRINILKSLCNDDGDLMY